MYVNGKIRPVEMIPGMGGKWIKKDGRGKFNYDIRTFINVILYPQNKNPIQKSTLSGSKILM
jgi:hypothetical protein